MIARFPDLTGKVVLITGGSRGLGLAMTKGFGAQGASVAIVSRDLKACEHAVEQVAELGGEGLAIAADVADWSRHQEVLDRVLNWRGQLNVLVNNAGKSPPYPDLLALEESQVLKVLSLNLVAPMRLSAICAESLSKSSSGSIVNISSIASQDPDPSALPYACAKAGLNALTVGLAAALAPRVRVNAILPGPFETDASQAWSPALRQRLIQRTLLQRVGEADEVVTAALFLASAGSSYITGSLLPVSGGW